LNLPQPSTLAPPSVVAVTAGLATGSIALLMLGLQPLLLGALAAESRLDEQGVGAAATAELLALGVTVGLLAALAPPSRLRLINGVAATVLAACNIWSMAAHGAGFVVARAAAGTAGGVLVWIAVALITRTRLPERASGIFLTVQTLAQAGLAALLPITLMPHFGANGGLASLAVLSACAMFASFWLPSELAALPKAEAGQGTLALPGLIGLTSVFFTMAGVVGLWIFVEQLGASPRIGAPAAGIAVACALVAQVAGSSVATLFSTRAPAMPVLFMVGLADLGSVWLLGEPIGAPVYLASVVLFGFLWLFAMPFQTRLMIDLDPTRRAAMLLSPAQLLGSAVGPLVTSAFATKTYLGGALRADAVMFAVGIACVVTTRKKGLIF
jgi:hypothetical protein